MPKILVVDDEPSIVDIISLALETEGLLVTSCATGSDALTEIESVIFDLIILDIGLPDMNGFELANRIRSNSNIPIIFLTARSSEIDRVVGLELGADDYVTKPFSPRELSARVKAVLRRTGANHSTNTSPPIVSTGLFKVDHESMQIFIRNMPLELSRTEFRLLALLIKTPGRVYSRDQLMDQAWEYSSISSDRTVDTHIKTIRQKIKAIHPEHDPIITHRGIGYSLLDDR